MQTFSEQRKAAFQCFLFHIIYILFCNAKLLFLQFFFQGVDFALQGGYLAIHIGQLGVDGACLEVHLWINGGRTNQLLTITLGVAGVEFYSNR